MDEYCPLEEILGGAIEGINRARTRKSRLLAAYDFFHRTSEQLKSFQVLPYTEEAQRHYESFTAADLRKGKNDCRHAAIALANGATVVTRNTRHFEGLVAVENWMD